MTNPLHLLRTTKTVLTAGAIAIGSMAGSAWSWSVSGTVKTTAGTPISGVIVTVTDSAKYIDTTDAQGGFKFESTTGVLGASRAEHFSAQVDGNELLVTSPSDGRLELSLVDASGRALWNTHAMANQGFARAQLPSGLTNSGIFLRVRHGAGVEYMAVSRGASGLIIAPTNAAARSMATNPVLKFTKSGYNDTTYSMASATMTGIVVTMSTSTVCDLPAKFKWKDNGAPLAGPKNGWTAIKDFTHVAYNGKHYVYMTYYLNGWNSAQMAPFTNWSDAANAAQTKTNTGVAPELMYFTPKKTWIMSKQWCGGASFCWMESNNIDNGTSFAQKGNLLTETITDDKKAPIDQTLICDDNKCYIFYADDNGRIYRGSMPKANFPGLFTGTTKILQDTQARLFEAVQVYKIKGQKKYLMIVECMSPRYFRAFTATDLGGTWTSLVGADTQASPFAGKNNVTGGWSDDISHGDIVRSSYDEYREIDPCNLQLLYQGYKPPFSGDYGMIPYQLGLLNLVR